MTNKALRLSGLGLIMGCFMGAIGMSILPMILCIVGGVMYIYGSELDEG